MTTDSSEIRVCLLGKFEISRGKKILRSNNWNRQKAAALLKRLAWERKLLKEVVVDHLWPEASLTSGSNNLYRALHEIRRTLDTYLGNGSADQIVSFPMAFSLYLIPCGWMRMNMRMLGKAPTLNT